MRFFTCDCDIATAENCGALTGHAFLGIPVPRALPWAEMFFPLRGGIPDRATSIRGVEGITISRSFPHARVPYQPDVQVLIFRFGSSPQRGSHKSAQGNALGPRQAATSLP